MALAPVAEHRAVSRDGTPIAYFQSGSGPSLLLVHGTAADHARWAPILPQLESHFTVYAVDRRGRGRSGDAKTYAVETEFEDLAQVIDQIGGEVFLLGHSYGAVCALEAALRTTRIAKLVLYEPLEPVGARFYPPELIAELERLLVQGDREAIVETFFREVVRMPENELTTLKSLPNWPARVAAAHTIPREMQLDRTYHFEPPRFATIRVPTLLLLGGNSPAFVKKATEAVHEALENSELGVMQGQQHTAMNTAPAMFNEQVIGFLLRRSDRGA
ncbi:MAG TPA: alpha/beta hydrolase [Anaeromyxobacteraceae bacterium]|nr:alpha/beta hydrolase [Anaeromyxobacteraceae bacterium]